MKKLLVFSLLPVVLFGLETVNLIKDAGFEKDSEEWLMRTIVYGGEIDSIVVDRHDESNSYSGYFSGSIDTRNEPLDELPSLYETGGYIYQIISNPKKLSDLDSLSFYHMLLYKTPEMSTSTGTYMVWLKFVDPFGDNRIDVYYGFRAPDYAFPDETTFRKVFFDSIGTEGMWDCLAANVREDLETKGLSEDIELDTFILYGDGLNDNRWRGQKAFFDDIRLMGYADYDVGIKEILSPDTIGALGESLRNSPQYEYVPVARIKNFGREDAEEFNVIAEVWDGESLIYEETISHTLPGDTEDTLEFPPFTPTYMTTYTLTIRTEMITPAIDECDEDDQLSKIIGTAGIADDPVTHLSIEVQAITSTLCIDYSLPAGEPASLSVYNATGRQIEHLPVTGAGSITIPSLPSGVYFVRLDAGFRVCTEKVVVFK